jgi:transcriptional regulator with XRE-family HTH domain
MNNTFGELLSRRRIAHGVGLRELARKAAISHVALLKIENGSGNASFSTAFKLATSLEPTQKEQSALLRSYLGVRLADEVREILSHT